MVVLVDSVTPTPPESSESDEVAFDASEVEFDADGDGISSVLVELSWAEARNRQDTNRHPVVGNDFIY